MRYCANLSILFKEAGFLDRFERAWRAGFSVVEFWWPSGEEPSEVERAVKEAGLEVALINFDAGDMPSGERGLISDPARREQFLANVPVALDLARAVGCKRLNALAGHEIPGMDRAEQLALARDNVRSAADAAADHGIEVLIEAVNTIENGPYLLYTTAQAAEFVRSVERDNVLLQYDAYHMQRMEGDLAATIREHVGVISHVQIADAPGRGEPGTGEIRYPYLLGVLEGLGYDGYVGLEYNPTTPTTEESLGWLPEKLRVSGGLVEGLAL
jgi:hydroxypyruvate isomerase